MFSSCALHKKNTHFDFQLNSHVNYNDLNLNTEMLPDYTLCNQHRAFLEYPNDTN